MAEILQMQSEHLAASHIVSMIYSIYTHFNSREESISVENSYDRMFVNVRGEKTWSSIRTQVSSVHGHSIHVSARSIAKINI